MTCFDPLTPSAFPAVKPSRSPWWKTARQTSVGSGDTRTYIHGFESNGPLLNPKKLRSTLKHQQKHRHWKMRILYIYILNTRIHIHYSTIIFNLYFSWPFSTRKSLDLCGFLLLLLGQATTSAFFKPHQPCFWHPQRASWPWAINPLGKLTHSWNSKKNGSN